MSLYPLRLLPEYRERVWGGQRLQPGPKPIGEAWVVYEHNRLAEGEHAGRTLGGLAAAEGERLLGRRPMRATGLRFPLLIKLLDCQDWLSVQVHPDDAQARALEGPEHFGKTEAWHILEAAPAASVVAGLKTGTTGAELARLMHSGATAQALAQAPVRAGDTVFVRAGTVHALGPGLLLYEVQQTSDITYRVYDWDRPASAGRELHVEKSLAVIDPAAACVLTPPPALTEGTAALTTCEYFTLELLAGAGGEWQGDTRGESFHTLTVIEGEAELVCGDWRGPLGRFATVVVPAACGPYTLHGRYRALRARA